MNWSNTLGPDWGTSEGRIAAVWAKIRGAGDTQARRMELLRHDRAELPKITHTEFNTLWERCQESGE